MGKWRSRRQFKLLPLEGLGLWLTIINQYVQTDSNIFHLCSSSPVSNIIISSNFPHRRTRVSSKKISIKTERRAGKTGEAKGKPTAWFIWHYEELERKIYTEKNITYSKCYFFCRTKRNKSNWKPTNRKFYKFCIFYSLEI